MEPTIKVGQVVDVDTAAYRKHVPTVGDVVVYYAPAGALSNQCGAPQPAGAVCGLPAGPKSSVRFIKRIAAGPGDTISISRGTVIRNGRPQPQRFSQTCSDIGLCQFPRSVKVPPGYWFTMGDSRGQSDDSRFFGPIAQAWIIGKVNVR